MSGSVKKCPHCGGTGAEPNLPGVPFQPGPGELHALCSQCAGVGSREWLEADYVRQAAPDMLTALRMVRECIAGGETVFPDAPSMLDAIDAYASEAIAKAEGR